MQKQAIVICRLLLMSGLLMYAWACAKNTTSSKGVSHTIILSDSTFFTYSLNELGDYNGPNIVLDSSDHYLNKKYLHFIDGKRVEDREKDKAFKKLRKKKVDSVNIIPAEEALELYGEKARYGAAIIRTKK